MSKRQIIMILGAIIILVALFSGFPPGWNTIIYVIIGVLTIVTSYLMQSTRSEVKPQSPYMDHSTTMDHSPTENKPAENLAATLSEMLVNPPSPDLSSTEVKQ